MNHMPLFEKINTIAADAMNLKNSYIPEFDLILDYITIFAQSSEEFDFYTTEALKNGTLAKEGETGIFITLNSPLETIFGNCLIVKVRKPDEARTENGDVIFTTASYHDTKLVLEDKDFVELHTTSEGIEIIKIVDNQIPVFIAITSKSQIAQLITHEDQGSEESQKDQSSVSSLQSQLEEERTKRLQLMADFQNFKKRMDSERATFGAIANMGLIQEILEISDDIQMALQDGELTIEHAKSAMKNAQDKISLASKNAGVEQISVNIGDEFDKTKMEAIQAIPSEEMKNKVITVISSAYKYVGQENILKPAKVIVGK